MTGSRLRLALVEAWYGGSHKAWANGFRDASRHNVVLLTLPGENWRWRMQGGAVTLAETLEQEVASNGPFDVVLASDMVDLAALSGIARGAMGDAALVLYMHENQLTYPVAVGAPDTSSLARVNWRSMCAADAVWFNSEFHRTEWFNALPDLLGKAPDQRHDRYVDSVEAKTTVVPVGVDLRRLDGPPEKPERATVIWNQRWEHDKDPNAFATAMVRLVAQGVDIDVVVCGEPSGTIPPSLRDLGSRIGDRLVHFGYADAAEYARLLARADIVVSTARQEYFGISITEAVYAGAFPVLPDRLVYPERLPTEVHPRCLYRDLNGLIDRVRWAQGHRDEARDIAASLRPSMAVYDWQVLAPEYDAALEALADDVSRRRSEP